MSILITATVIVWLLGVWSVCGVWGTQGILHKLQRLLTAIVFGSLGVILGMWLWFLHAFHVFSGETLVAHVTTQRLSGDEFELTYLPVTTGSHAPVHIRLHGDQWALGGGIVKWHPWLTALGVSSYYKPMRLSGQFSRLELQRVRPPTVSPLEPSEDAVWEALYRAAPYLPFIEAVYGSSASVYVEPSMVQDVYVTPVGYLIKRAASR